MIQNKILLEDMSYIKDKLSSMEKNKFKDATIIMTGCGGFLGYYFMHFFAHHAEELGIKKRKHRFRRYLFAVDCADFRHVVVCDLLAQR